MSDKTVLTEAEILADLREYHGTDGRYAADLIERQQERIKALEKDAVEWMRLAIAAANEAAGWYEECRGGARTDLPAVVAIDKALAALQNEPRQESKLASAIKLARGGEAPPPAFGSGSSASLPSDIRTFKKWAKDADK